HLAGWSGDASGTANPLAVTMDDPKSITATFVPNVPMLWVGVAGGGDGTSWANAANWVGGAVPGATDDVRLDNSSVTGDYTVTLPAVSGTRTVASLVIAPSAGRTITLTLPSGNTA